MERNYQNDQIQPVRCFRTQHPSGSKSNQRIGASVCSQRIDATESASGLLAAALNHPEVTHLNKTQPLIEDSEDEIDSPSEDEETERFTISDKEPGAVAVSTDDHDPYEEWLYEETKRFTISDKEPGPVAVTLDDDNDNYYDTDCVYHPRVYAIKKNALCLKRYQNEARPKSTKNKRVSWATSKYVKEFPSYEISDYWQSGRDTEKARTERRSEQFWEIP